MKRFVIFFGCTFLFLFAFQAGAQQSPSLGVFLFHNEECDACESVLQSYLSTLKSTYPFLEVKSFDVRDPSSRELLGTFEKRLGRKGDDLPVAFVEDHVLAGEKEIMEKLEFYVLEYQIRKGLSQPPFGFPGTANPS